MKVRSVLVVGGIAALAAGSYFAISYLRLGTTKQAMATPATIVGGAAQQHAGGPVPPQLSSSAAAPAQGTSSAGAVVATSSSAPSRRRPWDYQFLEGFRNAFQGTPIRFELVQSEFASGTVRHVEHKDGQVIYLAGDLTTPERGRFFFQKQSQPGKAGDFAGVVEFSASQRAFRLESTGPDGKTELVERALDQVVCLRLPLPENTNSVVEVPPLKPGEVIGHIPDYNDGIISLESLPGAQGVLYIDYRGGYTPTWGGITYERPNVSNAQIRDVWKRVAEDYIPFNINVTTDVKVFQNAAETSRQRCIITPTSTAAPGAGGVAYLQSWNWSGDTPCWVFMTTDKACAEAVSHEIGHTLWLGHDGQDVGSSHTEYYGGQGSGAVGWAPIMGVGYYQPVSQWSKGEYTNANNAEDDLNLITNKNNSIAYRADDTGSTLATSRYLELNPDFTAWAEGLIERTADTDAFQFTTTGGLMTLTANPVGDWGNLAVLATLANSANTVIATNSSQTSLSATITTNLSAGTYTFRVTGTGRNNSLTNGFSAYGSLGYYAITGYVAAARLPTRLSVAEHATNGTVVGSVPANNLYGSPLAYAIQSGNTGSTFSIDSTGTVRVANYALLDYYRLATNTTLAVQFELFVNITNLVDPALTELNRRVVIRVLDVNDAPIVAGFTNSVFEHSQAGLALGTVLVTNRDFRESVRFSIAGGDTNGMFAINSSGGISLAGDLNTSLQNVYNLLIAVSDDAAINPLVSTGYVTINVLTNRYPFRPGSISYATFDDIGSDTAVSALTNHSRFPADPTAEKQVSSFEGDTDRADNYGAVMRGYLLPPVSGTYTFWLATDDGGDLWLSTSTNRATLSRIAYISDWASPRQWTKFATQQSAARYLAGGQAYYIEARMKEGSGGDNIAVAWRGPATSNRTNVIAGQYLAPCYVNYVPYAAGFTAQVRRDTMAGARVGRVEATDANPQDHLSFSLTSGNTDGIFSIDGSGWIRVADAAALLAAGASSYTLTVEVTDSATPPLSATATVVLNVTEPAEMTLTSIQREMFYNTGDGTAVSDLTNNVRYPGRPDALVAMTSFASPVDVAEKYGSRIRAWLTPSTTGTYRFFLSSDDNGRLLFSSSGNPSNVVLIASVPGWTSANVWTSYSQQTSSSYYLVAGQRYYLEALQKEGGGGDHVEVGWAGPGIVDANGLASTNVIDGGFLTPLDLNYPPQLTNQTLQVFNSISNHTYVGNVYAADSPLDTLCFAIVAGNTNSMFSISPDTGGITVVDNTLIANGTLTNFPLTVQVQDSGYGGQFPLRTSQAVVTIRVVSTNNVSFVWTGGAQTNNWGDSANWGGVVPGAGARVVFGYASQQSNVNDQATSIGSVQFNCGGFNLSGNPVTLQSGLTNLSGDNTVAFNATLGAAQTWYNSGGTLALKGAVTNSGRLLTLVAGNDIALSGAVSGAGGVSKSGSARLLMAGAHGYSGTTVISAAGGTTAALQLSGPNDLDIHSSDLSLYGRMDLKHYNATIGALNGSGTIFANDLPQPTLTLGANSHSGSFSGIIQDNVDGYEVTLAVVKTGTGTQTLSGSNSFSGGMTVNSGVLTLSANNGCSPAGRGLLTIKSGAVVNSTTDNQLGNEGNGYLTPLNIAGGTFNAWNYTHANAVTFTGGLLGVASGASQVDGLDLRAYNTVNPLLVTLPSSSMATISSKVTLNAPTLCHIADGEPATDLLVSGSIFGAKSLTKSGPGTLALSSTCKYTGGTLITGGTLQLGIGGTSGSVVGNITNYYSLVFNRSGALTHSGLIIGSGSLTKTGTGTVTLTAANTYSGTTTVSQGTLALTAAGSISNSPVINVQAGAALEVTSVTGGFVIPPAQTLSGNGTIVGFARVYGTIAPGDPLGGLTFNTSVTLAGTTRLEIRKTGEVLTNDWLAATGLLTCGGTLLVTNSGDALVAGDSFLLLNSPLFAGNFNSLSLPPLGPGLHWNLDQLTTTGRITVAAPTPPQVQPVALSGGNLLLSFASEIGVSYVLQQADTLSAPIPWTSVSTNSGTGGVLTLSAPVDSMQPSRFFRLLAY